MICSLLSKLGRLETRGMKPITCETETAQAPFCLEPVVVENSGRAEPVGTPLEPLWSLRGTVLELLPGANRF
jgi:hypothetical protein